MSHASCLLAVGRSKINKRRHGNATTTNSRQFDPILPLICFYLVDWATPKYIHRGYTYDHGSVYTIVRPYLKLLPLAKCRCMANACN